MSVAKNNKRIMITINPLTEKLMDNIIKSSNGQITTYSKVVAFSVAVTHDALANYKDDNNDMKGEEN